MKKILIIGGGIAGLSAGIYAQQNGYQAEIYEQHAVCGGQCTGWFRKEYFIDNCIHWMTGTRKDTQLYKVWENIGALGEDIKLIQPESFYTVEHNGQQLTLWRDLNRTEREMLAISPEDEKEIHTFIENVRLAQSMQIPVEKPFYMMNLWDYVKLGRKMKNIGKVKKTYGTLTVEELAGKFKHPLIQSLMRDYLSKHFLSFALIASYATVTSGNGDIPIGGSLEMVQRIVKRFIELGGIIHTGVKVDKIQLEGNKALGIRLADGTFAKGDYVIPACDTFVTFNQLLDKKYMDKRLKAAYQNPSINPVFSTFHTAFAVDGLLKEVGKNLIFPCETITIGTQTFDTMGLKNYRSYGDAVAPSGKTVIQATFNQYENDYVYWEKLYPNRANYREVKQKLAEEILRRIEKRFPDYKGKITILDTWTPITYHRYCNSYYGTYMSFMSTKKSKSGIFTGKIKGLNNVVVASQWLMSPGGLPTAVVMGKFAVQYIKSVDK
jgi:phytoene dehydrogenase-like protein